MTMDISSYWVLGAIILLAVLVTFTIIWALFAERRRAEALAQAEKDCENARRNANNAVTEAEKRCEEAKLNATKAVEEAKKERDDARQMVQDTEEARLLRSQLGSLRDQLAEASERIRKGEELQKFLSDRPKLDAERAALEKQIAEKSVAVQSLSEKQRDFERLASQVRNLESELSALARDVEDAKGVKSNLDAEVETARRKHEETKQKLAEELKAALKDAEDHQRKVNEEIKKSEVERVRLENEMLRLKREKEQIEGEIIAANKLKAQVEREIEELSRKLAELKGNVDKMENLVREAKAAEERVRLANSQVEAVRATLSTLQRQSDALIRMSEQGKVVLRQAAFSDLRTRQVFERPHEAAPVTDETTALSNLRTHVDARGFDVSNRVLYAFHTSLKTADISSLTVMAGVSGTGKSALPAMYARAMGIHMVTMAVEPRWDSPRDLLGFFNYVTNRYESTPLARALFQFQGHYTGGFTPNVDLNDYMLMVMLDEMNLARIEYYFSEFLSKLEFRRGGNMSDDLHRKVVSLELFPGAHGEAHDGHPGFNEHPIGLFANYNTLFVGTMNEDETTQSLSDKVIDRANVLYFGRPLRLATQTSGAIPAAAPMMRRGTWCNPEDNNASWVKKLNANDIQPGERFFDAHQKLEAINEILGGIGRPFAHRTHQAILAYLTNYPYEAAIIDVHDLNVFFKRPLADQIGMRIMPKLRGLDLGMYNEPLVLVGKILGEIGDATLNDAFRKATDSANNKTGFFQWAGMDWANGEGQ